MKREGFTLAELLVGLALGGSVLVGLAILFVGVLRWADGISHRAEAVEVARTVWMILEEEVRPGLPGRDWHVAPDGALELRAFRGVARVCGSQNGRWTVAYRGFRAPDPARDSVLVLGLDGGWRPAALTGAWSGGDGCEALEGETVRQLTWTPTGDSGPVLVRVYERGRYSLEDAAFRYRRGLGGRQPLTVERVGDGSRLEAVGNALEVTLVVEGSTVGSAGIHFRWVTTPAEAAPP